MLCGTVYIVKAVLHEALPNCARLTVLYTYSAYSCIVYLYGLKLNRIRSLVMSSAVQTATSALSSWAKSRR
jgi:hypothetical protein